MHWTEIDEQPDKSAYIEFLDTANALTGVNQYKKRTFSVLDIREGMSVLDVGCGTGDDPAILAQLVGNHGRVTGIDSSAAMVQHASRRCKGIANVSILPGDIHALSFPDEAFDRVRTDRVL